MNMPGVIVSKKDFFNTYKLKTCAKKAYKNYKFLFPFGINVSLVRIFASLITDGFIDVRRQGNTLSYNYIGYFSKFKNQLYNFNKDFYNLFKIKGTIRDWGIRKVGKSYGCIIINASVSRILVLSGVPGGDKTVQNYDIPYWILRSNKKLKIEFLRRLFSCEGSIDKERSSGYWEIRYSMYKITELSYSAVEFLNSLRLILKEFGILTSRPYITQQYIRNKDNKLVIGYVIKIRQHSSILNFGKYIGFDICYKQRRMLKAIGELNIRKIGRNTYKDSFRSFS